MTADHHHHDACIERELQDDARLHQAHLEPQLIGRLVHGLLRYRRLVGQDERKPVLAQVLLHQVAVVQPAAHVPNRGATVNEVDGEVALMHTTKRKVWDFNKD